MEAILEERITNCGTSRRREEKGFAHAGGTQTRPHRGAGGRSQPGGSESAGGSSRQPRPGGGRSPRGGGERRRGRGGPRPRWGERWGRGQLRGRGTAGTGLGTGAAPGVGARRGQGSGGSARRQSARRVRVARHQPLFLLLLLLLFLLRPQSSKARRRYRPGSRHGNNDLARWKHHPSLRIVAPECVRNLKHQCEAFQSVCQPGSFMFPESAGEKSETTETQDSSGITLKTKDRRGVCLGWINSAGAHMGSSSVTAEFGTAMSTGPLLRMCEREGPTKCIKRDLLVY
ncbi:uncharacterized protein [Taeniopygia guttata]|uniref:uncharacterized protein n=1 Tax=Taeniopygia guttata TaxID=59729 RepID=UPI003BB999AC